MAPIDRICDDVFMNMVTCLNVCLLVLQEELIGGQFYVAASIGKCKVTPPQKKTLPFPHPHPHCRLHVDGAAMPFSLDQNLSAILIVHLKCLIRGRRK